MSSESSDQNFGKALDFIGPNVDKWIKELFKGLESLKIPASQKDFIQSLTVETMLFNTLMPNEEIVIVLAGIIQNVASKHSYADALDWGKRAELFKTYTESK